MEPSGLVPISNTGTRWGGWNQSWQAELLRDDTEGVERERKPSIYWKTICFCWFYMSMIMVIMSRSSPIGQFAYHQCKFFPLGIQDTGEVLILWVSITCMVEIKHEIIDSQLNCRQFWSTLYSTTQICSTVIFCVKFRWSNIIIFSKEIHLNCYFYHYRSSQQQWLPISKNALPGHLQSPAFLALGTSRHTAQRPLTDTTLPIINSGERCGKILALAPRHWCCLCGFRVEVDLVVEAPRFYKARILSPARLEHWHARTHSEHVSDTPKEVFNFFYFRTRYNTLRTHVGHATNMLRTRAERFFF